jgi:hypothetical protein
MGGHRQTHTPPQKTKKTRKAKKEKKDNEALPTTPTTTISHSSAEVASADFEAALTRIASRIAATSTQMQTQTPEKQKYLENQQKKQAKKQKQKQKNSQKQQKETQTQTKVSTLSNEVLLSRLRAFLSCSSPSFPSALRGEEFEKDVLALGHVGFMAAGANLRSKVKLV